MSFPPEEHCDFCGRETPQLVQVWDTSRESDSDVSQLACLECLERGRARSHAGVPVHAA